MCREISTLSRIRSYKWKSIVTRARHLTPHSHCLPTPPPMYEFSSSSQCADTRYPPENHLKDEAKSWREILIPERCLGGLISGASSLAGVAVRRRVEHNFFFFWESRIDKKG